MRTRLSPILIALLTMAALHSEAQIKIQRPPTKAGAARTQTLRKPPMRAVLASPSLAESEASDAQLSMMLRGTDPAKFLGSHRVVTNISRAGELRLMTSKDPTRSDQPSLSAAHVANMKLVGTTMRWKNHIVDISDDVLASPIGELPDIVMQINSIERIAHGHYRVWFKYRFPVPSKTSFPVWFRLSVEGPAGDHLSTVPWVHKAGGSGIFEGRTEAMIQGSAAPLAATSKSISITALTFGSGPRDLGRSATELGVARAIYEGKWYKQYEFITRDNIRDYIDAEGAAKDSIIIKPVAIEAPSVRKAPVTAVIKRPTTGVIRRTEVRPVTDMMSALSVVLRDVARGSVSDLTREYRDEPALLLFKTDEGNYAKAMIGLVRDSVTKPYHLRMIKTHTYAATSSTYAGIPGTGNAGTFNEEYARGWDAGGFLFATWGFDLDLWGTVCANDERDFALINYSGNQYISCSNGAKLAY